MQERIELSEEQQHLRDQMLMKYSCFATSLQLLAFCEEKLGKVNSFTIDFRKHIEKYHKDFSNSQDEFRESGAIDILCHNIPIDKDA